MGVVYGLWMVLLAGLVFPRLAGKVHLGLQAKLQSMQGVAAGIGAAAVFGAAGGVIYALLRFLGLLGLPFAATSWIYVLSFGLSMPVMAAMGLVLGRKRLKSVARSTRQEAQIERFAGPMAQRKQPLARLGALAGLWTFVWALIA
jgi:hypothetical protein